MVIDTIFQTSRVHIISQSMDLIVANPDQSHIDKSG